MKKLFEAIKNIKNSSRPVPPEGDVSDVYGGPIWPYLLVYKLWYLGLLMVIIWQWPEMNRDAFFGNMARWPRVGEIVFGSYLTTWDGAHYMSIAEQGYIPGSPSCAVWPLGPLLMRIGSWLTGGSCLISGMILSNLFSFFGLLWAHRLVEIHFGRRLANRTLLLMIFYPGALFFQFPYTESLFLFLMTGFLLSLENRNWFMVYLLGLLLPVTRSVGLFLLVPLVWYFWVCLKNEKDLGLGMRLFLVSVPIQGFLVYLFSMNMAAGDPMEAFQVQYHWGTNNANNLFDLPKFLLAFFDIRTWHDYSGSLLDRIFFVYSLPSLVLLWWYKRDWFWLGVVLCIFPAMIATYISYIRYLAVAFPVILGWALILDWVRSRTAVLVIYMLLLGLHAVLLWRHINSYWAG